MDSEQITRRLIETHRLRVGPRMAEHCLSRLQQPDSGVITLIGGDALTGVPRTLNVDPRELVDSKPNGNAPPPLAKCDKPDCAMVAARQSTRERN